ncbi:uncharacterized protein LOC108462484 [Gossypium arboreum]|uniref:uncharacterized protein LOC108462484 n=1 Tax=Gossypium arboreum TaxID=29729 RepID=UPI000818FEB7|nr:uncharacterized protein LOC108462484 [Gossypium arboreum]
MSTRGIYGWGTRGRGSMSNLDTGEMLVLPAIEARSHDHTAGDDALSQAMLRILERVAGPNTGAGGRGSVTERLRSNGDELFRIVVGVAPNVAEYWMEAKNRIMDDLDFTPEQKLKGTVSLLREEAYQWWLMIKEGTQLDRLTWDYFKTVFQSKYIGASYIDARRLEFLNLTQSDRSVREHELAVLVKKAKIAEDVKRAEHQNRDRERGRNKRDLEPSSSGLRPKKKAKSDGPMRDGPLVAPTGVALFGHCGRCHPGECWRTTGHV